MPDWRSIGYVRGMANKTGSVVSTLYPTRDICSAEDEAAFIAGFCEALRDFNNDGYKPFMAYVQERG